MVDKFTCLEDTMTNVSTFSGCICSIDHWRQVHLHIVQSWEISLLLHPVVHVGPVSVHSFICCLQALPVRFENVSVTRVLHLEVCTVFNWRLREAIVEPGVAFQLSAYQVISANRAFVATEKLHLRMGDARAVFHALLGVCFRDFILILGIKVSSAHDLPQLIITFPRWSNIPRAAFVAICFLTVASSKTPETSLSHRVTRSSRHRKRFIVTS